MKNFKKKILDTLKNKNKINSTLDYLSRIQKNLITNHSNPVFSDADKNKLLKKHAEFQELGESLYRHLMLTENGIESDVDENVVLKGGISYFKYIWHSENSNTTCEKCAELDGQEFSFEDEIPKRPHPNCKCTVVMIEEYDVNGNSNDNDNNKPPENKPKDKPKKWISPVPKGHKITSNYGNRMHPIKKKIIFHDGIDINAQLNTPISAVDSGMVSVAGWVSGYGYYIEIKHENDLSSFYAHLNKINVKINDKIEQGQDIGLSGNTGIGTAPHLHFGTKKNGKSANPLDYLPDF